MGRIIPSVSDNYLHKGTSVNSNGAIATITGYDNVDVEIVNNDSGTCTVTLQGSDGTQDGSGNPIFYTLGYNAFGGSRLTTPIAVGANSSQMISVADKGYELVRAVVSNVAGAVSLDVRVVAQA